MEKLKDFCKIRNLRFARQFLEKDLYLYRQHLVQKKYADKIIQGAIVLAWLGHSSSEMLDLYYHLHDEDSQQAMMELAKSDQPDTEKDASEGNLRATGESKIVKALQVPEIKELMECLYNSSEKAGFEPAVPQRVHWFSKPAP